MDAGQKAHMDEQAFSLARTDQDGRVELRLTGRLTLAEGAGLWQELRGHAKDLADSYRVDLSGVTQLDGAGAALLLAIRDEVAQGGGSFEFTAVPVDVQSMLALYDAGKNEAKPPPKRLGFLEQMGTATVEFFRSVVHLLDFVGDLTASAGAALRSPRSVQWADLGRLMERAGADGVPITLLINFLIGLILGLQSALQLEQFGVSIYVADLVGKSVTRELGPLMTAIIVAGRSGAAYAAELGTMRVSEEVDALQTLGFDPLRFLVFPRVIALALIVPLLTLLGDLVGCLGGLFVAVSYLDLTTVAYVNQLQSSLTLGDVFGGTVKAAVFAATIALVACQRGLATRGGAAGVGTSTTSAVVTILFSLVVLDAVFTVVFTFLGI